MRVKQVTNTTNNITPSNEELDNKILEAYKNAENLSLIPLLKLIYKTSKIDLSDKYQISKAISSLNELELSDLKSGEITLSNGSNNIKVYLDLVDRSYNLMSTLKKCDVLSDNVTNLVDEPNENLKNQLIQVITYLTQSIRITFDSLKNSQQELVEYNLLLDGNTTMYLDYDLETRIGIVFEQINN
jgi:hypothetical protein